MASVAYHIVVMFDRNGDGELVPGEAIEVESYEAAYRSPTAIGRAHAGVVAFSRTGGPSTGEFSDATVIMSIGEVDLDALTG